MKRDSELYGASPSPSEERKARAMAGAIPQQTIDGVLARLLRTRSYPPDELFCALVSKDDEVRLAERTKAEAALREALANALMLPSPTNIEAVGRCAMTLLQLAMRSVVVDHIEGPR